jgi:hypothetical protein
MNYKAQFYILLTILIISLLSLIGFYLINHNKNLVDNNSVKISFGGSMTCTSMLEYWKTKRVFKPYHLTSDEVKNDSVLKLIKTELNFLKQSFDSIHGIKVVFSNETPYKYYLELVNICTDKKPKYFIPIDNEIYALSMSKYELLDDSTINANNDKLQFDIIMENK